MPDQIPIRGQAAVPPGTPLQGLRQAEGDLAVALAELHGIVAAIDAAADKVRFARAELEAAALPRVAAAEAWAEYCARDPRRAPGGAADRRGGPVMPHPSVLPVREPASSDQIRTAGSPAPRYTVRMRPAGLVVFPAWVHDARHPDDPAGAPCCWCQDIRDAERIAAGLNRDEMYRATLGFLIVDEAAKPLDAEAAA